MLLSTLNQTSQPALNWEPYYGSPTRILPVAFCSFSFRPILQLGPGRLRLRYALSSRSATAVLGIVPIFLVAGVERSPGLQ